MLIIPGTEKMHHLLKFEMDWENFEFHRISQGSELPEKRKKARPTRTQNRVLACHEQCSIHLSYGTRPNGEGADKFSSLERQVTTHATYTDGTWVFSLLRRTNHGSIPNRTRALASKLGDCALLDGDLYAKCH